MSPELHTAATAGDPGGIENALTAGSQIDHRDRFGQTALMLAAHRGHVDVVRLLVARGADLEVTAKFGLSALMLAAIGGHREVYRVLLAAGADQTHRATGAAGFAGKTAAELWDTERP